MNLRGDERQTLLNLYEDLRLFKCLCYGLFDQYVDTVFQKIATDGKMKGRGHHHAYGIDLIYEIPVIGKRFGPKPFCNTFCPFGNDVHHAHELNALHAGIFLGMKLSEISDPYDSDA